MKKTLTLILFMCICALLTSCTIKEKIELAYGDTFTVESKKLEKYDNIVWVSEDPTIATVTGKTGKIAACAPGSTVVTASADGKVLKTYKVSVKTVPIDNVILSTNACTITDGDIYTFKYTLFPDDASDYGLEWKSANDAVATVHEYGKIKAVNPGQTTISVSTDKGLVATCSVTVKEKPAYDRLTFREKAFVDCCLKHMDSFKNPDSVRVKAVENSSTTSWVVRITAQNGFGGNGTEVYFLSDSLGFWNWDSLDIDLDVEINPDDTYDIQLINEAIAEKL